MQNQSIIFLLYCNTVTSKTCLIISWQTKNKKSNSNSNSSPWLEKRGNAALYYFVWFGPRKLKRSKLTLQIAKKLIQP